MNKTFLEVAIINYETQSTRGWYQLLYKVPSLEPRLDVQIRMFLLIVWACLLVQTTRMCVETLGEVEMTMICLPQG